MAYVLHFDVRSRMIVINSDITECISNKVNTYCFVLSISLSMKKVNFLTEHTTQNNIQRGRAIVKSTNLCKFLT